MNMDFSTLHRHVSSLDDFRLKWRFTEAAQARIPDVHLAQIQPLDAAGARFLWDYIARTGLHRNIPFAKGFFHTLDRAKIGDGNEKEIKKWLYRRGLPFDKPVYLSWQPTEAMIVPWKLLVKYFDSFYYGVSDDLTVIDQSLTWALLFYHEMEVYFGTNAPFTPGHDFDADRFSW